MTNQTAVDNVADTEAKGSRKWWPSALLAVIPLAGLYVVSVPAVRIATQLLAGNAIIGSLFGALFNVFRDGLAFDRQMLRDEMKEQRELYRDELVRQRAQHRDELTHERDLRVKDSENTLRWE